MDFSKFSFEEIQKLFEPGIFSVQCTINGKIFYTTAGTVPLGIGFFMQDLENNVCPNAELLSDYKKYGETAFVVEIVVADGKFLDKDLLEQELESVKKNSKHELY